MDSSGRVRESQIDRCFVIIGVPLFLPVFFFLFFFGWF